MTSRRTLDELSPTRRTPERIRALGAAVGREVLDRSPYLQAPNFATIHPSDLGLVVESCDRLFLEGHIARLRGSTPLHYRLSGRMTRAGGKTVRRRFPDRSEYEIVVSTTILFDGFARNDPEARVAGLPCANRLEALQRIVEHEIVHLLEFLHTGHSNCRAAPFQRFAATVFGHRSHTHELITRRERAAQQGILVGSLVTFADRGRPRTGRVNRITKRATVLVEDPLGQLYSDGKRYRKYYVPLAMLTTAENNNGGSPSGSA